MSRAAAFCLLRQKAGGVPPSGPAGSPGYFTVEQIAAIVGAPLANVARYWPPIYAELARRGLASRECVIAALATIGVEAGSFAPIDEYGGDDYYTRMYEGRADLGNIYPGDGARYHGRGPIQLTGRANYRNTGARIGVNLEADPDLAKDPAISALIFVDYFFQRSICARALEGDWSEVRFQVNGGYTGLARFLGLVNAFLAL